MGVAADHRSFDAGTVFESGVGHDDGVGDGHPCEPRIGTDGDVGTDAGVAKAGAGGDGDGTAELAGFEASAGFDEYRAFDGAAFERAMAAGSGAEGIEDDPVRGEDVVHLAGVDPVVVGEGGADGVARKDEPGQCVGDLEFATTAGLLASDDIEHGRAEGVDADDSEVRRRVDGLFDDPGEPATAEFGDTKGARVIDLLEDDGGGIAGGFEVADEGGYTAEQDVIAEVENEGGVAEEVPGNEDGMGDAERGVLLDIGKASAEGRTIAHSLADLFSGIADDDADVGDAGFHEVANREVEDGRVRNRHELFRARVSKGAKPAALPAGEDQAFHSRRL